MNIETTLNKVLNPVSKHGELIGVGAFMMKPNAIEGFADSIQRAMSGGLHMLEVENYINWIKDTNPNGANIIQAAAVGITGYILKDATNNPTISRLGEIAQKAATGWALTSAAFGALYFSTHSPPPPNMRSGSRTSTPVSNSNYMERSLS
jgi:hypothetical protein